MGDLPSETGEESTRSSGFFRGAAASLASLAARPKVNAAAMAAKAIRPERSLDFMEGLTTETRRQSSMAQPSFATAPPGRRENIFSTDKPARPRRLEALDAEKAGDALVGVDALNRLAEQGGDAEHGDGQTARVDRRRVRRDEFVDETALQALERDIVENAVTDRRADAARALVAENFCRGRQRAGRLGDVIDEQHVAAVDFADDIDRL